MTKGDILTDTQRALLTVKQASRRLAISERTLYNLTAPRGEIECIRIGRALRYSPKALDSFIESKRIRQKDDVQ